MSNGFARVFLLALLLGGCSSPFVPEGTAGRFVLQEIDGDPLPAVFVSNAYVTTEILADTLWLENDGTGLRRVTYRSTETGRSPSTYRSEDPFTYERIDGRIEISLVCEDVIIRSMASCIPPPHFVGTVEPTGLTVTDFHDNRLRYAVR